MKGLRTTPCPELVEGDYGLRTKNRENFFSPFWSLVPGPWSLVLLLFLGPFCLVPGPVFADPGAQRIFEADIAPDLRATWVVVDDFPQKGEAAQTALQQASLNARQTLDRLDPLNPFSEISLLLAKKEVGTFPVSPELAQILYTTQTIAKELGEPMAKRIKVDPEKNEVKLKGTDVIIN
ncbi:MAG: hypothetical protein HY609_02435, partial [Deltaproteobacteria bacterium]|nr:hypothetical protein [Deltaproteobacteria bacterium]